MKALATLLAAKATLKTLAPKIEKITCPKKIAEIRERLDKLKATCDKILR